MMRGLLMRLDSGNNLPAKPVDTQWAPRHTVFSPNFNTRSAWAI